MVTAQGSQTGTRYRMMTRERNVALVGYAAGAKSPYACQQSCQVTNFIIAGKYNFNQLSSRLTTSATALLGALPNLTIPISVSITMDELKES